MVAEQADQAHGEHGCHEEYEEDVKSSGSKFQAIAPENNEVAERECKNHKAVQECVSQEKDEELVVVEANTVVNPLKIKMRNHVITLHHRLLDKQLKKRPMWPQSPRKKIT